MLSGVSAPIPTIAKCPIFVRVKATTTLLRVLRRCIYMCICRDVGTFSTYRTWPDPIYRGSAVCRTYLIPSIWSTLKCLCVSCARISQLLLPFGISNFNDSILAFISLGSEQSTWTTKKRLREERPVVLWHIHVCVCVEEIFVLIYCGSIEFIGSVFIMCFEYLIQYRIIAIPQPIINDYPS